MNWVPVVSTVFTSVAYDEGTRQLYLTFHSGKTYRYFEFPAHQYAEFLAADSQGKYSGRIFGASSAIKRFTRTHRTAS